MLIYLRGETMTKRFIYDGMYIRDLHNKIPSILTDNDEQIDKYLTELNNLQQELTERDQRIKELENTIKTLVIKLFEPPCIDNEDNDYEVLRKYLNEEYDINCTQIDIDVKNEKMLLKIEGETMPDNEPAFKKKLEEIIGDSTGLEAAKKVAEYYRKNHRYDYYDYGPDGKPKRIRRKGEWKQCQTDMK